MINPKLLDILVCPETKQKVTLAAEPEILALNQKIEKGQVKNRAGAEVRDRVEGLLVRQDQQFAYPVRDGIPVMLIDEGIPFSGN